MENDLKFNLKQKFNIKCGIDITIFGLICVVFIIFAFRNQIPMYSFLTYFALVLVLYLPAHFFTTQWISRSMKKSLTLQSEALAETTFDIMNAMNDQKRTLENLCTNAKNTSTLVDKLKTLKGLQRGIVAMSLIRIGESAVAPLKALACEDKNYQWMADYLLSEI